MSVYRWNIANCDPALAAQLACDLQIAPLVARCLVNRGFANAEIASRYLEPKLATLNDPFLLPEMDRAVDRLLRAHERREKIVLFGDYDVDGVTSTALLTQFFEALGWLSVYYLPHRVEDGYGLSIEAVTKCLDRFKPQLLIAVDCGASSFDVIHWLKEQGVDVIVLDHHQVSAPRPEAHALVNPQLGSDESARNLCSAGLAFKLAHALLKQCRALGWPEAARFDLREFLDLVALGTIADVVPLRGENRVFAAAGLERLRSTRRAGLVALKRVAGLNGAIGPYEVGFQLGPRLNAAGRLETALDSLELLLTRDEKRAAALAEALQEQNRERQEIEKRIVEEALGAVRASFNPASDYAIVEGRGDWHIGVVGIVASRVQREFYRPTIILGGDGPDQLRGSGRSVPGFDLAAGLRSCGELLRKSGGHAMAAGLTLDSCRLGDFRTRFNEIVKSSLDVQGLRPVIEIDGEVKLSDLHFQSLKALARLQPVGHGNPPAQFVARGLSLRGEPRFLGSNQQHCRFLAGDSSGSHPVLWWNCPRRNVMPARFDLVFAPELNEFNGKVSVQLKMIDLEPRP